MAKVYYYSKRYSQQGDPIKTVTHLDLFTISRVVATVAPYKLGFRTLSATLNQLKTYTINEFKTKGITFKYSDGLVGVGSTIDPVRVDKDWVNQSYIRASDWPFSQIGDPTDFTLPIDGSYFSVSYPFISDIGSPVIPYVEGNGDMRILRTVTNGEDVAVVYSVWKNYKNTNIATMRHSDIVYEPPGLASDEYIFHVYGATETAMLVEIWSKSSGFRDYAFVILNGTMVASYHRIIRLGKGPLTNMIGVTTTTDQNSWMSYIRACNINAVIVKDKKYIGMICPVGVLSGTTINGDNSINRLIFAEVSDAGAVTLLKNWTATNSEGNVVSSSNFAVLNRTLSTSVAADKDAVFLNLAPTTTLGFGTGYNSTNKSYWGGVNSKGYVTAINYHYYTVHTNLAERDAKPSFYYDIDFDNRRVIASDNATNRRWSYTTSADNLPQRVASSKTYLEGHYYVDGRMVGLLNNGDRYCQHIPGNTGIGQILYVMRGAVTSIDTGTNDVNFLNDNLHSGRYMNVSPPTATISGCKATILYDKLRILNYGGEGGGNSYTTTSLSLLSGNIAGKTYKLLDSNINNPPINWTGYPLNNNRVVGPNPQPPGMIAVRKNGVIYYHNAAWSHADSVNNTYSYGIDSNSVGHYALKLHQNVVDQMNAFKQLLPIHTGYTEISDQYWSILPIYPGIGEDYAFVRFLSSSKTPDSTGPDGWARSGTGQIFAMVPITYVIDSLGIATITSVDLSKVSNVHTPYSGVNALGDQSWHTYGSAAIDITSTDYNLIHRGGCSGSYYANGTTEPMWPQALSFDKSLVRKKWYSNCGGVGYGPFPTISPTHGIGFVDVVGLGAFYAFRPYSFDTNKIGTPQESYIVGTARPAAGFNLTVNAPFNVYVEGCKYVIPVQTLDLTTITSSYRNAHFYCYVVIRDGMAKFVVDKNRLDENLHRIYIGYIKTSDTEISEINCKPVTRWEVARPSIYPIGNALPASPGLPNDTDVIVWENIKTIEGDGVEYLWGSDDIIDSDVDYMITDLYWAHDQLGDVPLTTDPLFGETIYLIVKTFGISDYVEITFDSNGLQSNDFQDGNIVGTIKVPLTFNVGTNVGIGYHKVRTWEVDDMAFNNATWLAVTAQRAFNVDYTNDLNFAIQVNIGISAGDGKGFNRTSLLVDGVDVGGGRVDVTDGGGRTSMTLSAIVPSKSKYRLVQGSGVYIESWAELGRR